jgi:hypothetical protein
MSSQLIKGLLSNIESRLDIIEEYLDELEDNEVDVESFRINLGKVWESLSNLQDEQ